jgi:hypothetical protein
MTREAQGAAILKAAHFETCGRAGEMRVARGNRVRCRPAVGAAEASQ